MSNLLAGNCLTKGWWRIGSRVDEYIRRKIRSFPRWHYRFDLLGNQTPVFDGKLVRRHDFRRGHFFGPLVDLLGGTLAGKRVLDLGCNAGFWSLAAVEAGCDYVLGIDGRKMHVDQAEFVFEVKEIDDDRYRFVEANIFDLRLADFGSFDVVLCLGLLYHVNKPVSLMEQISQVNTDLLVIDTTLSDAEGSYMELRRETLEDPRNSVDHELVMVPTVQAVRDLAGAFGYSVATLKPDPPKIVGLHDYRKGHRRAFICSRSTDLSKLSATAGVELYSPATQTRLGENS